MVISFIIIGISEFITKTESRFKEAFIAMTSLWEFGSWCTVLVFLYAR